MKVIPLRLDVVSKKSYPKDRLLRLLIRPEVRIDHEQTALGRAIYFAKDLEGFEYALKKGRLRRYGLSEAIIEEIRQWMGKNTASSAC